MVELMEKADYHTAMYKTIYVPADNSDHSNRSVELAVKLGKAMGSELTGSHVYAAKMHDKRFKQMEFTLPEEYQEEKELDRQRKIHDSLITMGLQLISDSYLDVMERLSCKEGVPFSRKSFDGRNFQLVVEDIQKSQYDLVIMGALGTGAVKESVLGSVTERVVRRARTDVLVVRDVSPWEEQFKRGIVVAIDGSPQSYAGLKIAIELSKLVHCPLEAVAVYDPYLHYTVFSGIVDVLSEKAAKVFKFKEQEKLHEEIIDTGLAKIYQAHLEVAQVVAKDEGVELKITLMDGKAYEKVLQYVRTTKPWLLIMGRIGYHSDDTMDIGSNSENLLRLSPSNCLLVSRKFIPPIDMKADAAVTWSDEALERMQKIPEFVRGIARTALIRYSMEHGHSIITSSVIDKVMDLFMPKRSEQAVASLAYDVALSEAQNGATRFICLRCGHVVKIETRPSQCGVCEAEGSEFQKIDRSVAQAIVTQEGGTQQEETFDGVSLKWTDEARKQLLELPAGFLRKRARARIEKTAKVKGYETITMELASRLVAEIKEGVENVAPPSAAASVGTDEAAPSPFTWTDAAAARLERVPAGFMRDMTKKKVEDLASVKGVTTVTLEITEEALVAARQMMAEMVATYAKGGDTKTAIQASVPKPAI